jgi:hypothetical protein
MKHSIFIWFLLVYSLLSATVGYGQRQRSDLLQEYDNEGKAIKMGFHLGFMLPGHDLKDRYGSFNAIGMEVDYHFNESPWALGFGFAHTFGQNVKDDVVSNLRDSNGEIIGLNKAYTAFVIRQRGWHFFAKIDRLLFADASGKTGLLVSLRPGIYQHYVRLQDEENAVPQVLGEYKQGYDRLAFGPSFTQFIGYQYMSPRRTFNFYIGVETTQAFTLEKRSFFFNRPGEFIEPKRLDTVFGLKAGWILPLYFVSDPSTLFY